VEAPNVVVSAVGMAQQNEDNRRKFITNLKEPDFSQVYTVGTTMAAHFLVGFKKKKTTNTRKGKIMPREQTLDVAAYANCGSMPISVE
jgi:hypothetical protein